VSVINMSLRLGFRKYIFFVACLLGLAPRSYTQGPEVTKPAGGETQPTLQSDALLAADQGQPSGQNGAAATAPQTHQEQDKCSDVTLDPGQARVAPDGEITITATPGKNCTLPEDLTWANSDDWNDKTLARFNFNKSAADLILGSRSAVTAKIDSNKSQRYLFITASSSKSKAQAIARVVVTLEPAGDVVIPVIGFEQAGASSAQSDQKFFFSFFISGPLPFGVGAFAKETASAAPNDHSSQESKSARNSIFGTRMHWWGDVRIASYPQQISSGIGSLL
jgi:hypothetical protein